MRQFNDRHLKSLTTPARGNCITYDPSTPGLGLRITAAGAKSFVLNYRFAGRERRYTIGPYGTDQWTLVRARKRAGELRRMIEGGKDPLALRQEARKAETINDLADRFVEQHFHKLRPSTRRDYGGILARYIRPTLGSLKVIDITYGHVDGLHRKITKAGAPYRANRTVALLSKMFALAVRWKLRSDNPAKGIERNQELKRQTYLSPDALLRLSTVLDTHRDKQAANIVRLLLLTGARRSEVQGARWDQLDLDLGVWTKPGSTTKQKTEHRAPISAAAVALLKELREAAHDDDAVFVFPSRGKTGYRIEMKKDWAELRAKAKIGNEVRLHDLRHTFASLLASAGMSLPIVGALLGHSQPGTTARYAHLYDDPLRRAAEAAAAVVTGKPSAEVVPFVRQG
jgi:integrase